MRIGILIIDMISKEMNMGGNVFCTRVIILGLISIYASRIVFKSSGLNIASLEEFIQM